MAAGDFTNIRVESTTPDSATIRYSYAGSGDIVLYRSVAGAAYAAFQSIPALYGSYPTIVDDTVDAETVYSYKFTDDAGLTFSSIVSVKTQKLFPEPNTEVSSVGLPAFTSEDSVNAENLDAMRVQLEDALNSEKHTVQRECEVCPVNGAIVIDCSEGCYSFVVEQDNITDINSISLNCEKFEIKFEIPDGTTTEICGWDAESGFDGDECFQAPVSSSVQRAVVRTRPSPCPISRTRQTSAPCLRDYIYECYTKGSLQRAKTRPTRNVPVLNCNCSLISTGTTSEDLDGWLWTVRSGYRGPKDKKSTPHAGMSLLYKPVNTNCTGAVPATILEHVIGGFTAFTLKVITVGQPLFGFAINVPKDVTIRNFTGHVLLFDYPNNRYLWGKYTNGDLLAGNYPTTLGSISMSTITPTQVKTIVSPNPVYSSFDVTLETATQTETLPHTSIPLVASPFGFGVIWVANLTDGTHAAMLDNKYESALVWW